MEVLIKTGFFDDSQSDFILPLQLRYTSTASDVVIGPDELSSTEDAPNAADPEHIPIKLNTISEESENNKLLEEKRLEELAGKIKEDAYRDGYAESILDVKARYNEQLEEIDSLIVSINEALPTYLKKNEPVIASIVFESVCKIIGKELADNSKSISVVNSIIKELDKNKVREILISQKDFNSLENLETHLSSDGIMLENLFNKLTFKVDPEIQYGGCKIKLIDGFLDASIDGQLNVLSKSLKEKTEDLAR